MSLQTSKIMFYWFFLPNSNSVDVFILWYIGLFPGKILSSQTCFDKGETLKAYTFNLCCNLILPSNHRLAWCGVAPLRLETGRYERLPKAERMCPFCNSELENEIHAMINCPFYEDIRYNLFEKAKLLDANFNTFTDEQKYIFVFKTQDMIGISANTCFFILQRRSSYLYR